MSVRLKEVVFKVKCRWPGCPYVEDVSIKENIMGLTEADVDSEAWKIARGVSYNKHDAIHGNFHPLTDPSIVKVSGTYERLGGLTPSQPPAAELPPAAPAVPDTAALERKIQGLEAANAALVEKLRVSAKKPGPKKAAPRKAAKAAPKKGAKKPAKRPTAKKPARKPAKKAARKPASKKPAKRR